LSTKTRQTRATTTKATAESAKTAAQTKEDLKQKKLKGKWRQRQKAELEAARKQLLICRTFPKVCVPGMKRLQLSIASIQKLTKKARTQLYAWAMTWCLTILVATNWRKWWAAPTRSDASSTKETTFTTTFAGRWCGGWFGEISCAASTLRLFVGAIVLLECSGLMTPELNVFAAPEVVALATFPKYPKQTHSIVHEPDVVQTVLPDLGPDTRAACVSRLLKLRFACVLAFCIFVVTPAPSSGSSSSGPSSSSSPSGGCLPNVVLRLVALLAYAVGAACYGVLGAVGLMYDHCHSVQGAILLVGALTVVVYDVSDDPRDARGRRAARWLRTFLFVSVLAPIYLCSGLSKMRYEGLYDNFVRARWLKRGLLDSPQRQTFRAINEYIAHTKSLLVLFSVGNQLFETGVSLLVLFAGATPMLQEAFNVALLVTAAAFHVYVFFFLGPNFMRLGVMLLFAADPVGLLVVLRRKLTCKKTCFDLGGDSQGGAASSSSWENKHHRDLEVEEDDDDDDDFVALAPLNRLSQRHLLPKVKDLPLEKKRSGEETRKTDVLIGKPSLFDQFRAAFGFATLLAFMRVQLASDYHHVAGVIPAVQKHNPYFPIPEFSMFTSPTKENNSYKAIAALDVLIVIGLTIKYGPFGGTLRKFFPGAAKYRRRDC